MFTSVMAHAFVFIRRLLLHNMNKKLVIKLDHLFMHALKCRDKRVNLKNNSTISITVLSIFQMICMTFYFPKVAV